MTLTQLKVGLSERQRQIVEVEAARLGVPLSEAVRRILDQWIDEHQLQQQFQQKSRARKK